MQKYNRLIMFCDYGLDDAIATVHILKNAHMFERIDIAPIGGNVPVGVALRNAHTLLAAAHADVDKVRIVDTTPLCQYAADIPDVHGVDGIGDILKATPSAHTVIEFGTFKAELEKTADPEHDCVLSLGPCTVPAELGYSPKTTVIMGGATHEPPNYGAYEFNEACDVAAFRALSKTATGVATLDTCHDRRFAFDRYKMNIELADRLIARYMQLCRNRGAVETIYDLVAAIAVTDPEMFATSQTVRADGTEYKELRLKG